MLIKPKITKATKEAIEILQQYNNWRRAKLDNNLNPVPMPNPREVGEAIDYVIYILKYQNVMVIEKAEKKEKK